MEQKKTANINIREPKKHKKQINQNPYHFAGTNPGSGTVNGSRSYPVTLSLKLVQKRGPIKTTFSNAAHDTFTPIP